MVKNGIKGQQLQVNPFPSSILGDCGNNILKVESDNLFSLREIKHYAHMLNKRYHLDGFIILQSSVKTHEIWNVETNIKENVVYRYKTRNYHIVFNRKIKSVAELHSIIAWLCLITKDWNLILWFLLQCVKQTITLRNGFKGRIRPPRIVYRYGNQDKMIREFLDNREFILNFLNRDDKNV